jgi:uncharacterized cupin superfamily protein
MHKLNINEVPEELWSSPKGTFAGGYKGISIAMGRKPHSTDLRERHPFDIELCRVPAGKKNFPYHSHSAQWEFYLIISGRGTVRHKDGTTPVSAGDAVLFPPGEPHQIINDSPDDLTFYVIADNPFGESFHYPDSNKWCVTSPEKRYLRSAPIAYEDGEE